MANVDEDLDQLEKDIRQLKIEYDQYFGGGRPRPPADTQWRVEQIIKRYNERGGHINFPQRFRFNNLLQTYAKYQEIFRKRLKQKEEGHVQRHFGATAKALEAERAKSRRVGAEPADAAGKAARPNEYVITCSDPEREADKVQELFRVLVEAKELAGENIDALSLENFKRLVREKTRQLKQEKGTDQVEYAVSIEQGQVKLRARVRG